MSSAPHDGQVVASERQPNPSATQVTFAGIADHTTFEGERYDPDIGVFGMDVCITLAKPGHRVKHRRLLARRIPKRHRVTRDEALSFLAQKFNVEVL